MAEHSMEGQIDRSRLLIPGLAGLYQSIAPYSYAIIRFCAGAILIYHGYGKLFGGMIGAVAQNVTTPLGLPNPLAWAHFLGVLEFFGGALLAIGFLTRPIALTLTIEFIIITWWHHVNGYSFASPKGDPNIRCCSPLFMQRSSFAGPGASIDRMIGKEV